MSKAFSARFAIQGSIATGQPNEFDVFGDVLDTSLDGFSVSDVQVDDLIYDENTLSGEHTRWKVTSVVATGPGSIFGGGGATACHLIVLFDDSGTTPAGGPTAGSGAICRATSANKLSEIPSQSLKGISESLATRIRNIDARQIIDPLLGTGGGGGSTVSHENTYTNQSGETLPVLTPVRSSGGDLDKIDVSSEAEVSAILGITNILMNHTASGTVVLNGLIENITTAIALDSTVYLSKTGGLTDTAPDIGVGGFVAGDFVVVLGKITKNSSNPAQKDFLVDIQIRGQL